MEEKKGYLEADFKLFHICDRQKKEYNFHYHEFKKIIVFLSGEVTYIIEGKAYHLKPWDILLVDAFNIHKPVIDAGITYDRLIIYVNSDFLQRESSRDCNLNACFVKALEKSYNLIRTDEKIQEKMKRVIELLIEERESAAGNDAYGKDILKKSLFLEFLVYLNRIFVVDNYDTGNYSYAFDSKITEILDYINENLDQELSVKSISEKFFLSKYYLMHKFKDETGYTLHNYVTVKRCKKAAAYIATGMPVMMAAKKGGFNDYTSFLRSYKKIYKKNPGEK
ncbi:AraC-type DNA-binding protein [Acetitomaculum ruminis DSM 5522]|uniref:AraC-type DNA-binding protein n=1 Tax=Acetitomaculum ruminis DSM 5522 TaxID=1120918 RepID=A0A1I0XVC1_9FIRM|nr:AraC family transcriptional regulator [Acetitomaculum ruminis]SFB03923.1 AraC-type DNA-binding protein [Acetitomaculum ruminis DSM 5522]